MTLSSSRLLVSALVLILGIVSLESLAQAVFDYESDHSALRIVTPSLLKDVGGAGGIKHSQALFGTPSYGDKKIVGQVFYVTPYDNQTGCDDFTETRPTDAEAPEGTHKIFLVDRGSCDFVQKMRVAQKHDVVAVIIADNLCQCSDYDNTTMWKADSPNGRTPKQRERCEQLAAKAVDEKRLSPGTKCEGSLPYMADDGRGNDVLIPSFLIDYLDAQPLKDCIASAKGQLTADQLLSGSKFACSKDTKLVVSLEWDLPRSDNLVKWELWSSSDSEGVFKKAFARTGKRLQDNTIFTPHYFIWNGRDWGCNIGDICATQCTKGGLYCNPDPDQDLFNGVEGKDVVEENLRELCIWDQASKAGKEDLWWDYVVKFAENCHPETIPKAETYNQACSESVQGKIPGLDVEKTRACVANSWKGDTNELLEAEIRARMGYKILTLPTVRVNDVTLRGGVTPLNVMNSICAVFLPGQAPRMCTCVDRVNSDNLLECINSECGEKEQLCKKDNMCYSKDVYPTKCTDICPKTTDMYCSTLNQCLPQTAVCPSCPEASKPTFCPILNECVGSIVECSPKQGTSAFGVFMITVVVVSIAGCGLYVFWKRQRAKLQDDVRSILSSYMALGEGDDVDNERVSRQARTRVEPTNSSQTTVGEQDAAQYI